MAKIRVQDLATMMGIPQQDLVFKLRSIGVRVEGEEAGVEMEMLQAILQGKKLTSPREVIMDDAEQAPAPPRRAGTPAPTAPPATAARRPAVNPLRPGKPRTIIQKVEPRIKTLPTLERPASEAPEIGAEEGLPLAVTPVELAPAPAPPPTVAAEPTVAAAAPTAAAPTAPAPAAEPAPAAVAATPAAPAAPAPAAPPAPPRRGAVLIHRATEPYRPTPPPGRGRPGSGPPRPGMGPGRPGGPGARPGYGGGPGRPGMGGGPGRPGPGGRPGMGAGPGRPGMGPGRPAPGMRPGGPPPPAGPGRDQRRDGPGRDSDQKKGKKGRKTVVPQANDASIRTLRGGTLEQIEEVVDNAVVPTGSLGGRRRRRPDEREDEVVTVKPTRSVDEGPVVISEGMTVRDFAEKVGVKVKDLIALLFRRGILANINHVIEPELGVKLAEQFGFQTKVMTFEEEIQASHAVDQPEAEVTVGTTPRAPVVTIMGHVDHGKTSLLDKIRKSKIVDSEFGGITQHIGAYSVDVGSRKIVFLDTPGHEAFTLMRARGARVTDVVILVVAADDGVMPQTIEAIAHARAAGVPILVALNKIDKPNANPDRVKQQLSDKGLAPEDWGGQTVVVPVSALKGEGIDALLEMVVLTADLLELKADPERPAQGVVLEARKETGRGVIATVLVQNGTLKVGDVFVSGATWGRVRAMNDDRGKRIHESGPATAVEVTGFDDVPEAGDTFQAVGDEQKARGIVEFRQLEARKRDLVPSSGKLSLEALFSRIQAGEIKDLGVVLKADVQGSVEVLRESIEKLSTPKVKVSVLHSGVGAVSTNDVLLASASKAVIVGFNVRPERNAAELAEKEQVEIRLYTVIYELLDELKKAMVGLLEPTFKEVFKGRAEVRDTFKVPKVGTIAGCHVVEGSIPRTAAVRLVRDGRVIHEGKIASLKRFKDDASEVRAGFDCGIGFERFQDVKPGDVIEAFVKEEVAPTLA